MAYGIIDDACLKDLADDLRDTLKLDKESTVGFSNSSIAHYKLKDYICRIPGKSSSNYSWIDTTALLCEVVINIGNIKNADNKSIKISYITADEDGNCTVNTIDHTVDPNRIDYELNATIHVVRGSVITVQAASGDLFDGAHLTATVAGNTVSWRWEGSSTQMSMWIQTHCTLGVALYYQ